ncbi:MAG: general secretion pathway protein GspK, partial [Deltaproteobacteria bacterium]|nr:general secretion pathway protein GspK [Deltaproteobacteria bacterium]
MNRSRFHGLWPGYFNARTGVALLLTLLVTGLLSASTLSFIRMANLEARVADNTYALTQAEILAQAGLRGAMALLSLDKKEYDDLTEPWADFNRFAAMASMLLEEGSFKGKIEDLSRRVNLNALLDKNGLVVLEKQNQVQRLFMLLELDPALMEPLLDWLDRDDDPRSNSSAEGLYYLSLERPYPCANGPLETLGQLTLLKDFTPA